ncbi:class I SAM-dependent methyltransferase [Chloroflexota bacterium]
MRENFIDYLKCPLCEGSSFELIVQEQNATEIREGQILCSGCQAKFTISRGVLDFLPNPNPIVEKVQGGCLKHDLLPGGLSFKLKDLDRYEKQILALPDGDGSDIFKRDTLFRNISDAAYVFYQGLSLLRLTGKERLLDLGADICWSTNKFAELGCQCVALDINHHLPVSDVYIHKNNVYFERIVTDMGDLPFADKSFDIVVTVTSIHHASDLGNTFREIARVLAPRGKAILINEPVRRIFASKDYGSERSRELMLNENHYTALEYHSAAKKAGLKLTFKPNIPPILFSIAPSDRRWKKMIKPFLNKYPWRIIKSFLDKYPWITRFARVPIHILLFYKPVKMMMTAHK